MTSCFKKEKFIRFNSPGAARAARNVVFVMHKYFRIAAVALTLIASRSAFSGEVPLQVVTEEFPPFNYTENGGVVGRYTAEVRAVLDKAGIPYSIKVLPWAEAYHKAQTEPNVLIYTLYRMPFRAGLFQWVRPLGVNKQSQLYRLSSDPSPKPTSLNDVKGRAIGCDTKDGAHCQLLIALGFKNVIPHDNQGISGLVKSLKEKRVEYIIEDQEVLPRALREARIPADSVYSVMGVFSASPYFALSNNTDPLIATRLRAAYDELRQAGKIRPEY